MQTPADLPLRESPNAASGTVRTEPPASETNAREAWGLTGLLIYAIATLGSQATMSIGIAFAIVGQWIQFGGPREYFRALRSTTTTFAVRRYLLWTNSLTLACFVSLVGARFFPVRYGSRTPDVRFLHDMWKAWYFYWPILLLPGLSRLSGGAATRFRDVYLFAAAAVGALGWIQFFTGFPTDRPIPYMERFHHVQGFFGHHLSFASIMIFPFFLLLEETVRRFRERGDPTRTWIFAIATFVFCVALFGTFSRMLWIGLPIGIAIFFVLRLEGAKRWWILGALVIALFGAVQLKPVHDRIENAMGTEERVTLWKINGEFFSRRPITGVGWHHNLPLSAGWFEEKFPETKDQKFVGHAHNNVIEVAASLGILGLIAFLGWSLFVLRLSAMYSIGLFAAWIVFQFNGLTQVNFWEAKVLHTMGLTLAILLARAARDRDGGNALPAFGRARAALVPEVGV